MLQQYRKTCYTEVAVAVVVSTLDTLLAEIHTTLGTPTMPGALLPETPTTGIPPTGSHHLFGVMHTETVGVIDLGVEARPVPDIMTRMSAYFKTILASCFTVTAGCPFHANSHL